MSQCQDIEFIPLKGFDGYLIMNKYPFTIKSERLNRCIKEQKMQDGFYRLKLNNKLYFKHKVIAQQFLPNPNVYDYVSHLNGNNSDNRLVNLLWVPNRRMKTEFYFEAMRNQ